ncbi:DNA repair protein REV1, putative [Plasmodium knowlesi strain H]|uniref:DNA repair protein REV1, putative n=3 Tax=Plasmodium knowlesi TaxID=5850 RepID=A0A5K1UAK7_PLAKH|nr:DNA repair protein REV1, putative [Plasmodium knowlesi strain H]OTN67545.1 putative DNA repair protein REV1 [Plasmodium knowlesi]CAA9987375.1 DNA repair protein REV1, putative [Plasmodium knowlesi strain H]SBO23332.1 DNA repair protein REV1, putative [Plasmodium knowlesi strain H]SBO24440.1 DNA repair protein REV1, putative [Plasmodium knowlesi strain H]VVS76849.1 DNA repair protein REV1, putative [Plasmodium knowlesi strain H]|eukprot:XP_002258378.1 hypothetical protein, conserved in Plasmodium species [Plasmodium knowlesi strain H]
MDLEYGGSRSFGAYMCRKEEKTPLSYNKKYSAEIEEAEERNKKDKHEDSRNTRPLFTNCNFYIDDFVSLYSIYNKCDKDHKKDEEVEEEKERESPSQRTTLYRGQEEHKLDPHNEWNNLTTHADDKTVDRYHNNLNNQGECSTPYNNCDLDENNYANFWSNDFERTELIKLHDRPVQIGDMSLERTPTKSTLYGLPETLQNNYTSRERNKFDTFVKRYETVQTSKKNVQASYINKKEQIEIMIVQNGGVIHNALTNKVTHIISNNMALGSKKYMDYKKAIKKSKVFIVVDKYIFDCVKFRCRFPEQSYLPSLLRHNSRQITEFFPFKKRRMYTIGKVHSLDASNICAQNNTPVSTQLQEKHNSIAVKFSEKDFMSDDNLSGKFLRESIQSDKHLLMLNMQMSYTNLKNYLVCNSSEYFKRLRVIYQKKELEENAFPNVGANLYMNRNTFEDFARNHRILRHLNDEEINWIKKKSQLNINIKNIWENDMIHLFFDIVLRTKDNEEVGASMECRSREEEKKEGIRCKSEDVSSSEKSEGLSESNYNHLPGGGYPSEKLIDSVDAYLHKSRLYILGNWKYISREFFKFQDINEKDKRKCVYLYIDFDNYFLNASVKSACEQCDNNKKIGSNEILCVCHSLKKEDSYSIVSATNYWGKKNKIHKGMVKWEVTNMHKDNIRFVKYDFGNILRCSYLFLLVLINYSKNVRVLSVDESIVQLFYENEEDLFLTAKQIAEDIYNLTNLSVSIGISSNLSMSRKALKFCKKRFLFFDYYHHFCIFIMGKYFLGEGIDEQINREGHAHSVTSQDNFEERTARTEEGDDIVREENYAAEGGQSKNEPLNCEELKNLFDEYVASAVAEGNQVNGTCDATTSSHSDLYFLNAMKEKRDPRVDSIFNKFVQANRANLEHITSTFFDRVIHPISRFFFFYKKKEHYLDVLRQLNYLSGQFIHFNIYHLPVDERAAPILPCDQVSEDVFIKSKKKEIDPIEGKKSINISVNYGVRFQNINDFYFLIYFMTKQLYIRLRINSLKAKSLHVHFFLNEEGENVDPVKYLGRGKVSRVNSRINLSHYTDNFFVYFFKVIYTFDVLASRLRDLRGVQIVCSDVVSADAIRALAKRSILSYFPVGGKGNMKDEKEIKLGVDEGAHVIAPNMRDAQVHPIREKNANDDEKRTRHILRHHRCGHGGKSKRRNSVPLVNGRCAKSILCYFVNTKNAEAEAEKKVDISSDKCVPFSFKSGAKKNKKKINKKKNNGSVRRATNSLSPSSCRILKKIKTVRNYKILDFFPSIFLKQRSQGNTTTKHNDPHVKKWIDRNTLTTDKNIFDSIINKRVKKEVHIKEEFNCCYVSYRNILQAVMEKQKSLTTMCENQYVWANESRNDTIFSHSYIIVSLYAMNRESEKGILYSYTKEIISSYISHFNNLHRNHDCRNNATDRYYLLKFIAAVVDSLCEELHRRRLLDVLHKFLKNFKHVWCLTYAEDGRDKGNEKSTFPPLFHRIMVKYGVY